MVMPPGAIVSNAVVGDLVFTYRYNNKNLLCTKKVPGADSVKYYYNNRNLLMLTQDGNMRAESPNKYFGIDYDPLGRKWATGLISTTHPVDDAMYNWYFWTKNLTYDYYIPNTNLLAGTNTASLGAINTALGDRSMMFRSIQYNAKGERDWGCSEYLRFHNCEDYLFNTDGTLKSATKYNNGANGYQVFYSQLYAYDHSRRLKTTRQQLWGPNGTGTNFFAPIVELSALTYNHKDQVTEKNIGRRTDVSGAKALQSIDYAYNQRGWLSGINQMPVSMHNAILRTRNGQQVLDIDPNPTYNIASGEGSVDLFSESIRYDAPDANFAAVTPQYNGNISQVMWQVAGKERQAYTYTYDPLDRMTAGVYTDVHDEYIAELAATIGQPYDPTFERDNKYNETLTYDVRGNITKLSRNGMYTLTQNNGGYLKGTFGQIDSLQYTYNNKNQITTIVDKAPAANRYKGFNYYDYYVEAYTYDKNGNLSKDKNKGIDTIIYNYMNLPERIEFVYNRRIEFIYDATGMKLRKSVSFPSDPFNLNSARYTTTTDYMDGFEYEDDKIQRIAHTEGYISRREKRSTESSEFVGMGGLVWQYNYVLKDHLGNTRVTFADTTGNGLIDPTIEIAQINHYYPFGLNMDGNWNGASPNVKNNYQYNDKELQTDFGLNWNDYGARMYDPAMARWNSIDPLAAQYLRYSPYNYGKLNPIKFIDPNGMEVVEMTDRTRYTGADAIKKFIELNGGSKGAASPPGIHLNSVGDIITNSARKGDATPNVYLTVGGKSTLLGQIGGVIDVSAIYRNLLEQNIAIASGMLDPRTFRTFVQTGGIWDYKVRYNQPGRLNTIFEMVNMVYRNNTTFSFNGVKMDAQDIGNHHFGVMGKATGSWLFPEETLLKAAGAAQIAAGTSKLEWRNYEQLETGEGNVTLTMLPPYGDDPRDQNWIKAGFEYWKNRQRP